jgi:hypothetical protein
MLSRSCARNTSLCSQICSGAKSMKTARHFFTKIFNIPRARSKTPCFWFSIFQSQLNGQPGSFTLVGKPPVPLCRSLILHDRLVTALCSAIKSGSRFTLEPLDMLIEMIQSRLLTSSTENWSKSQQNHLGFANGSCHFRHAPQG